MKLTPKQKAFVDEYLVDLNATQAAIRAGYSAKTAEWIGPQLISKTHVSAAIAERMKARSDRTEITQDKVLKEIARIAFSDIRKIMTKDGKILLPHELDSDTAAAIASFKVTFDGGIEYKFWDKNAALEKLARHLGMFEKDNKQRTDPLSDLITKLSGNVIGVSDKKKESTE